MGTTVSFQRPDGASVQGYLAESAEGAGGPSVVVIQEWWGLNDQIRGVADRLARAGYHALVPDLYRGKFTVEAEEAHHLMGGLNFGEAASQDIRGALTVLSMTMVPEADAGVVWYGLPPLEFVDAGRIRAPLMAHWAEQDAAFAIDSVDALENKLAEAGVAYTGHRYLAYHAFANETAQGPRRFPFTQYDAAWAQLAWDRTLRFFGRHLG